MILFEHERIRVGQSIGGEELSSRAFEAIAAWQERSKVRYLELGHHSVRATQWVGVLQVGREVLEILPKADANCYGPDERDVSAGYWRKVLLQMLATARGFDLRLDQRADLRLQSHSLLDLFFWLFVRESERILREGLVKTYRTVAKNRTAWRGRLLVGKDLIQNLVHRERVFTEAMEFDTHNPWNRILVAALQVVSSRSNDSLLEARVRGLLLPFQDWTPGRIGPEVFEHLRYDRRTERYREAMELARLILMRQSPDLAPGHQDVFSLLFDMNKLWEAWVAHSLRQQVQSKGWTLRTQSSRVFWRGGSTSEALTTKTIRPDLLLEPGSVKSALPEWNGLPKIDCPTVLDTKWKLLDSWIPSDADLKQMYAYNRLYGTPQALLLYPKPRGTDSRLPGQGLFNDSEKSRCAVAFFELPR